MNGYPVVVAFLVFLAGLTAHADEPVRQYTAGTDRFVAGSVAYVTQPVAGDLIAAGGTVDVRALVSGDLIAAAGEVRVDANAGQDLYAAGGRVLVNAAVSRNARLAGGTVEITPDARIMGNLSVAAGRVDIRGHIDGYLQVSSGYVYINGPVGGNVRASAGEVELGPQARISGTLRYAANRELKRDPAAQVQGGIQRTAQTVPWETAKRVTAFAVAAWWIWMIGLLILAAVLVAALPGFFASLTQTLRERLPLSVLLGFVVLVCVPVAVLLLLVTMIGAPLAVLVGLAYWAALMVGYISAGIALGNSAIRRGQQQWSEVRGRRIGAAVLGVLVIALLGAIPFLGPLVSFIALCAGLGALALRLYRGREAAPAV